jgi:L-asparagine oxygenase
MSALEAPVELFLDGAEGEQVRELAAILAGSGADPLEADFYDRWWPMVERLPVRLRKFLEDFRRTEPAAACLVHGLAPDETALGPTPTHWNSPVGDRPALAQEIYLGLCGMILGEPFTWATLQSGRLVQDILPIAGEEQRQSGFGSNALLEFHTEDGFHPRRCDYLLLFGLRNHDRVPTIVSSVRDLKLDPDDRDILAQKRFYIFPDDEHVRQLERRDPDHPALHRIRQMLKTPEPVRVLFGDALNPYLRVDRPFMRTVDDDPAAIHALDALMAELERVQRDVVVGPGTLLVVDNYLAVHGRRPFDARYDGTDRWLKKLTVSRNLRMGRAGTRVLV